MSKVVNVKVKYLRPEYDNLEEWMKKRNHVYIARHGIVFIHNKRFPKHSSIFANPYKITAKLDRDESMRLYKIYATKRLKEDKKFEKELLKLRGKTLGCWCKPLKCHGDILIRLLKKYDK